QAFRLCSVGQPAWDGIDLPFGPIAGLERRTHDLPERRRQFVERCLDAACNIEYFIGNVRFGGKDVCPRDVFNKDKVHALAAVAKDEARKTGGEPAHPTDQHLRIDAMDVHSWAAHIEVPE